MSDEGNEGTVFPELMPGRSPSGASAGAFDATALLDQLDRGRSDTLGRRSVPQEGIEESSAVPTPAAAAVPGTDDGEGQQARKQAVRRPSVNFREALDGGRRRSKTKGSRKDSFSGRADRSRNNSVSGRADRSRNNSVSGRNDRSRNISFGNMAAAGLAEAASEALRNFALGEMQAQSSSAAGGASGSTRVFGNEGADASLRTERRDASARGDGTAGRRRPFNPSEPVQDAHFARTPVIIDMDATPTNVLALLWLIAAHLAGEVAILGITVSGTSNVLDQESYYTIASILQASGLPADLLYSWAPAMNEHKRRASSSVLLSLAGDLAPHGEAKEPSPAKSPVDFLVEKLKEYAGDVSILCLGPVTNLNGVNSVAPNLLNSARDIIVLGGAFHVPGNCTPAGELNACIDPVALQTLLTSYSSTIIVPLDAKPCFRIKEATVDVLSSASRHAGPGRGLDSEQATKLRRFLSELFYYARMEQSSTGPTTPLEVAALGAACFLICPDYLSVRRSSVVVETGGVHCAGKTLFDSATPRLQRPNAWVVMGADGDAAVSRFERDLYLLLR